MVLIFQNDCITCSSPKTCCRIHLNIVHNNGNHNGNHDRNVELLVVVTIVFTVNLDDYVMLSIFMNNQIYVRSTSQNEKAVQISTQAFFILLKIQNKVNID